MIRRIEMAWWYLFIAGVFEVAWAVGLKYTDGFTRLMPTIITVLCLIASMALLALAVRALPLGTAYAVWTGIGTIGTVIIGIMLFHEPVNAVRVICIILILAGIAGLKLTAKA
jgi:quaternary ammonium compound-resistance protein SugE